MDLQKRYGPIEEIWTYRRDMDLQKRYGPTEEIWTYRRDMDLQKLAESVQGAQRAGKSANLTTASISSSRKRIHPIRNQQHRLDVVHQLCVSRASDIHRLTSFGQNELVLALVFPTLCPHDLGDYVEPRLRSVDLKANLQRALKLFDRPFAQYSSFRYVANKPLPYFLKKNQREDITVDKLGEMSN
ncbi:hypothetical protein E4U52_002087 [Claviceps spartinae]|nr:hypothetical protein E4U52_002087 [Claviceps spartinae]